MAFKGGLVSDGTKLTTREYYVEIDFVLTTATFLAAPQSYIQLSMLDLSKSDAMRQSFLAPPPEQAALLSNCVSS